MGVCINILGIPILEDRECAEARRASREGRIEVRKSARTDRVTARQDARTERTELRNADGTSPIEGVAGEVGSFLESGHDLAGQVLGLFGVGTDPVTGETDVGPLVLVLALGAGAYFITKG